MKSALPPSAPKPLLLPSALSPSDAAVLATPPFSRHSFVDNENSCPNLIRLQLL
jgi:hypothetical protein